MFAYRQSQQQASPLTNSSLVHLQFLFVVAAYVAAYSGRLVSRWSKRFGAPYGCLRLHASRHLAVR